jgi:ribonuclease HI
MEITAVGKALLSVENLDLDVTIFTDSKYVIKGITEWINNWKKNDWIKKDGEKVANEFYWKRICEILEKRKSKINKKIEFKYVPGHSGFVLNDRCDELAVQCSKKEKPDLHSEDLIQFEKRLGFKLDEELKKISSYKKDDSKGTASNSQQYLSLVNGIVKYHSTWADCELRVKGQSNAKFKKCKNQTEVADTLKAWGMQKD